MKLADEMLLAQMRESVLQDVPDDQWNLVIREVEKAGGVRQVEGYAKTLLHDAIQKASFGGDRSEAGRYAANVRWQGKGEAKLNDGGGGRYAADVRWQGKGKSKESKTEVKTRSGVSLKDADLSEISSIIRADLKAQGKKIPFGAEPYLDALDTMGDISEKYFEDDGSSIVAYTLSNLASYRGETARQVKAELNARFKGNMAERDRQDEELKEGNIADELPKSNLPPLNNDWGDEEGDDERAGRMLREAMVPLDTKNPKASVNTPQARNKKKP